VKFLFDNHIPLGLSAAMRAFQKSVAHVRDIQALGPKAPDPLIMQYGGENGYFVVTRDLAQAEEPWFKPTILQTKAGYFFLRASKRKGVEPNGWDLCKLMVKAWDDMERYAAEHSVPFMALIQPNGRVSNYR
jgi:hypothetical protein